MGPRCDAGPAHSLQSFRRNLRSDRGGPRERAGRSTTPRQVRATVSLGLSGETVTLVQDEAGAWCRGTTEATEGMTIPTPIGTRYRLSFVNGAWVATEVDGIAPSWGARGSVLGRKLLEHMVSRLEWLRLQGHPRPTRTVAPVWRFQVDRHKRF